MEVPGFFKVFLPSNSSERLLIPTAFVEHLKRTKTIPGRAFLRNSNGRLWSVEVIKVGNEMFFSSGWAKFVEENCLELGDFMTFDYDDDGIFNFKLFGATACEKACFLKKEEEEEKEDEEEEKEEEEKEEEEEEEEEEECGMEDNDDTDDWKNDDTDEDELSEEEEIEVIKKTKDGDYKGKAAINVQDGSKISGNGENDEDEDEDEDVDEDIFKYGIISPPNNPYFVARFEAKRRKELYIPRDIIKNHNLEFPSKLFLHDEEGRKWQSNVVRWKDGRTWLSIGWRRFSKRNRLVSDDRCICEFIREKGQQVTFLKLRTLRAGSWLPKTS